MKAVTGTLVTLFSLAMSMSFPGSGANAQAAPPGAQPGRTGRSDRTATAQREELERRFRERLDIIVKQRLNLTDEQNTRLREVASRLEESRRQLRRDEYAMRMAMRRELMAGDRANAARVGELLDQMPRLERRRLELMEQEQKELAKFLTPIQRGRYLGLQEELRVGMQEMQWRRLDRGDSTHRRPPNDSDAMSRMREMFQR